jgi:hypothetical protein
LPLRRRRVLLCRRPLRSRCTPTRPPLAACTCLAAMAHLRHGRCRRRRAGHRGPADGERRRRGAARRRPPATSTWDPLCSTQATSGDLDMGISGDLDMARRSRPSRMAGDPYTPARTTVTSVAPNPPSRSKDGAKRGNETGVGSLSPPKSDGSTQPASHGNIPSRVGPYPSHSPSKQPKKGFDPSGFDPFYQPNTLVRYNQ